MALSSRPLKRLKLDAGVASCLDKHGVKTGEDLVTRTDLDLMDILTRSRRGMATALESAWDKLGPHVVTAQELWEEETATDDLRLPTGLSPHLDKVLGGGLCTGTITEVVGNAGAGKTQLCTWLAAAAHSHFPAGSSVLFIDSEGTFCSRRLCRFAASLAGPGGGARDRVQQTAEGVHVVQVASAQELLEYLTSDNLSDMMLQLRVRLLVVDSVAALILPVNDVRHLRASRLGKIASALKQLASLHSAAVLVTNHVGNFSYDDDRVSHDAPTYTSESIAPQLGRPWAHYVNTRLVLTCPPEALLPPASPHPAPSGKPPVLRRLTVAKSPVCPVISYSFSIERGSLSAVKTPTSQ